MRVLLVCGLLGSGKTTLILNKLKDPSAKTVVIVNDFGQTGIDGEVLAKGGFQSIELPSGCVCCTLVADLVSCITGVRERYSPEELIIEPSGIASPSGVLNALYSMGLKDITVIGLIDASEFLEICHADFYGPFFGEQVRLADILVINKTDLASPQVLDEIEEVLERLNPKAMILRAVRGMVPVESLPEIQSPERKMPALSFKGHSPHLDFETVTLEPDENISRSFILAFLHKARSGVYGQIARAKGLINTEEGAFKFDLSFGHIEEKRLEGPVERNRLVIIGKGLKRELMEAAIN